TNGSGKTTLLRAVLGLHRNFAGRILVGGRDTRSAAERAWRRRACAWIRQKPAAGRFPLLGRELLASSASGAEAVEAADKLGVGHLADRPPARPRLSDADDWRTAAECAPPRGLPGFDDGIALTELLDTLPDERRQAFVLTQLLGLPYAEAAELSDCTIDTVRSRVARARSSLMRSLHDAERAEPVGAAV
ncbi:sigma factor-like helix-turn-helix DNA-binding protein, partial [Streptomyces sp. NPDC001698]|uniref:sigma factor-like helix-turn-helix DNA-binding protein n=1 Tax=unclassified Streptomyces TaxID=2593676 RepID=UPI0036CA07BB